MHGRIFLLTYYALRKMHSVSELISLSFKQINVRLSSGRPDRRLARCFNTVMCLGRWLKTVWSTWTQRNFLIQPAFVSSALRCMISSISFFFCANELCSVVKHFAGKWLIKTRLRWSRTCKSCAGTCEASPNWRNFYFEEKRNEEKTGFKKLKIIACFEDWNFVL